MKKVDFGCGTSKRKGFIGVDVLPLPGVDIVHDLNKFPYPFKDDEIDFAWMDQVLEHVEDPLSEEILRGGFKGKDLIKISVKTEDDGNKHLYFDAQATAPAAAPAAHGEEAKQLAQAASDAT